MVPDKMQAMILPMIPQIIVTNIWIEEVTYNVSQGVIHLLRGWVSEEVGDFVSRRLDFLNG